MPALAYFALIAVLVGIFAGIAIAVSPTETYSEYDYGPSAGFSTSFGFVGIVVLLIGALVTIVAAGAIQSAYISGLLEIANGQPVDIGSFFKPRNIGGVVIASLIIGVASMIGSLCFIGSIVVAFFTIFAIPALLDRNLAPIDAIKASFEIVKTNVVPVLLVYLVTGAVVLVGYIACGIGLIVALPVAGLFQVYAYRKLSGGPVAPLTP